MSNHRFSTPASASQLLGEIDITRPLIWELEHDYDKLRLNLTWTLNESFIESSIKKPSKYHQENCDSNSKASFSGNGLLMDMLIDSFTAPQPPLKNTMAQNSIVNNLVDSLVDLVRAVFYDALEKATNTIQESDTNKKGTMGTRDEAIHEQRQKETEQGKYQTNLVESKAKLLSAIENVFNIFILFTGKERFDPPRDCDNTCADCCSDSTSIAGEAFTISSDNLSTEAAITRENSIASLEWCGEDSATCNTSSRKKRRSVDSPTKIPGGPTQTKFYTLHPDLAESGIHSGKDRTFSIDNIKFEDKRGTENNELHPSPKSQLGNGFRSDGYDYCTQRSNADLTRGTDGDISIVNISTNEAKNVSMDNTNIDSVVLENTSSNNVNHLAENTNLADATYTNMPNNSSEMENINGQIFNHIADTNRETLLYNNEMLVHDSLNNCVQQCNGTSPGVSKRLPCTLDIDLMTTHCSTISDEKCKSFLLLVEDNECPKIKEPINNHSSDSLPPNEYEGSSCNSLNEIPIENYDSTVSDSQNRSLLEKGDVSRKTEKQDSSKTSDNSVHFEGDNCADITEEKQAGSCVESQHRTTERVLFDNIFRPSGGTNETKDDKCHDNIQNDTIITDITSQPEIVSSGLPATCFDEIENNIQDKQPTVTIPASTIASDNTTQPKITSSDLVSICSDQMENDSPVKHQTSTTHASTIVSDITNQSELASSGSAVNRADEMENNIESQQSTVTTHASTIASDITTQSATTSSENNSQVKHKPSTTHASTIVPDITNQPEIASSSGSASTRSNQMENDIQVNHKTSTNHAGTILSDIKTQSAITSSGLAAACFNEIESNLQDKQPTVTTPASTIASDITTQPKIANSDMVSICSDQMENDSQVKHQTSTTHASTIVSDITNQPELASSGSAGNRSDKMENNLQSQQPTVTTHASTIASDITSQPAITSSGLVSTCSDQMENDINVKHRIGTTLASTITSDITTQSALTCLASACSGQMGNDLQGKHQTITTLASTITSDMTTQPVITSSSLASTCSGQVYNDLHVKVNNCEEKSILTSSMSVSPRNNAARRQSKIPRSTSLRKIETKNGASGFHPTCSKDMGIPNSLFRGYYDIVLQRINSPPPRTKASKGDEKKTGTSFSESIKYRRSPMTFRNTTSSGTTTKTRNQLQKTYDEYIEESKKLEANMRQNSSDDIQSAAVQRNRSFTKSPTHNSFENGSRNNSFVKSSRENSFACRNNSLVITSRSNTYTKPENTNMGSPILERNEKPKLTKNVLSCNKYWKKISSENNKSRIPLLCGGC